MYEFLVKLFGKDADGNPEALTAEQLIAKIKADKSLNLVNLKDGGYVSKEKFDAKDTELTGVKQQLADANTTIQSYKDMDIDGIKKSAQDWETKYKTDTKALNDKLEAQERSHRTDLFLSGYKFSSKAAEAGIRSMFDAKGFKLENGEFLGAADYIKQLQEDKDYKGAFVIEKEDDPDDAGSGAGGTQTPPPFFAAGTNGGAGAGGKGEPLKIDFGFTHLREPAKN